MKSWRILSILSLPLVLGLVGLRPAAAASHVSEASFTVPAGETITVEVSAFCLEYGEPFPESVSLSARKAPIDARRVMKAAALSGALEEEPLQTQLAIWRAIEDEWSIDEEDEDFALAVALYEASDKQNTAPLNAQGLPLNALLSDAVEVEVVGWEALEAERIDEDDEPYYGRATLEIRNIGGADLELYLPVGLVLEASDEDEQDMGIVALDGESAMMSDASDEDAADSEDEAAEDEEDAATDDEDADASDDADEASDTDEATGDEAADVGETMDDSTEDPGELPVTGLPGVPDTLLAMILGAIVLSAGLVLRRA